ncbi:MAG: two-component system response regulator [Methylotenera sp.]|nr:MAG: two-component system response regulator [Methylotenera sp.]
MSAGLIIKNPIIQNLNVENPTIFNDALYKDKIRAEIALNSISDAVICTDIYGNIDYLNIAAEKITGWSREEAAGHPFSHVFQIIDGTSRQPIPSPVNLVLQSNQTMGLAADTVLIRRDGSEIEIADSASPILDWDGKLTGVVVVFHDVSVAKAMSLKMSHLAQHDFLTNLPNRVLLNDRIAQAIASANRYGTKVALLFLDLDNFKHINDSLGHATGDKLLQSVTKRLSASVRNTDTVSRQGGDEFIILLEDSKTGKNAALTAEKILDELTLPHEIGKCQLYITTSIGISVYPQDGLDGETLLKSADTAMYYAKEKGRNNYQFFKNEMNTRAVQRLKIEADLRVALEKHQFELLYQPKINLNNNQMTGVECLLRWQHDEWGQMMPEAFIGIAEESGLIVPIGRWVLREACKQAKEWLDNSLPATTIAVNISAKEFLQKDFVESVRAVLVETQLPTHLLELEITESVLMRDAQSSTAILHQLKQMGIQLAVDDFGTGYSSLSYLQQFPIDVLKIDQSFIHHIASATDEGIIVSAIISMGNSLKLRVIAEGIENKVQLDFLKSRHCEEGQGYFFSKALTAKAFAEKFLTSNIN